MSSRCPRCKTRCTEGELVSAIFDAPTRPMVAVDVGGETAYVSPDAAAKLNLVGHEGWVRREITRETATRMVVIDTEGGPAFMEATAAAKLGLTGRKYWRHESDRVCGACIEELRRGNRAHRSYSDARRKWRSA